MKLEQIKETKCKECGAAIVSEKRDQQHTNSRFNESRTFACGKVIHHYPNFDEKDITVITECSHSPHIITRIEKRAKFYEKIIALIDKSNVDEEYKELLKRSIRFA